MAGIGPISTDRKTLSKRAGYRSSLAQPRSELEIFCSLCVGRVYMDHRNRYLYFVDSPAFSVSEIVSSVFHGLGDEPVIEQLYMDQNRVIKAALRLQLDARQKKSMLIALRLNGIFIDGAQTADEES